MKILVASVKLRTFLHSAYCVVINRILLSDLLRIVYRTSECESFIDISVQLSKSYLILLCVQLSAAFNQSS